ncbi:MAG: hypothetical protein HY088_07095 [Ignavibacteriales bacterium]|nr:hypothetical protein [Ignavibacteriales bacterium]
MRVEKDFEEFIKLLNKHKVEYLVVGAYAVAFHGHPRNTGDIDIFINSNESNATKLLRALKDFGFKSLGPKKEDFLDPYSVVQFGFEPNRIDIISSIDGVKFGTAFKEKVQGKMGQERVWFISLNHLLRNKQSTERKKDQADVELLLKLRKKKEKK